MKTRTDTTRSDNGPTPPPIIANDPAPQGVDVAFVEGVFSRLKAELADRLGRVFILEEQVARFQQDLAITRARLAAVTTTTEKTEPEKP